MSATPFVPRTTLYKALKKMQMVQLATLTTGGGCGLTTQEMARVLDTETSYGMMYETLADLVECVRNQISGNYSPRIEELIRKADYILAKARGEV